MLKCPDPMCNVVVEKLQAARQFYTSQPIKPSKNANSSGPVNAGMDVEM